MKVLFIICNGDGQLQTTTSDQGVTRTQHAAREYHRNAKLRRAKNKCYSAHDNDRQTTTKPKKCRSTGLANVAGAPKLQLEQHSPLRTILGASRTDPFNTACQSNVPLYVHEMLDHAISYQWSEFRLSDDGAGLNAAKADIMQSVMKSPVAWYAVIFAGATHHAYQHGARGPSKQNEQLRLWYKIKAISALLDDLGQNGDQVSEETLLSMITLTSHGSGESLRGTDSPKRQDLPFLSHVHDVEYYASMDTCLEHLNAVYYLVDKRGGLRTIRLRSLAICLQLYDIFASWKQLRPPHFSLLAPTKHYISLRSHKTDAVARSLLQKRTTGFQALLNDAYTNLDRIVEVANCASILSADFDQLLRCYSLPKHQRFEAPSIALVKFTRWCVLHDILTLPLCEADHVVEPEHTVYELCRHILLAYALFVLVPMPSKSKLHERIADRFERILDAAVEVGIPAKHADLFLCAIGWGWMFADEAVKHHKLDKLRQSFFGLLQFTAVNLEFHAWPIVANVMKSFLWLEAFCEQPGWNFWACACGLAERDFKMGQEPPIVQTE